MKKIGTLLFASLALVATSCSTTSEESNTETVEAVSYSLDKENTSLIWAANMGPDYGHEGTIDITEGSITMEGESLTEGSFVIDMNSIKSTDLEDPKAGYLNGHLTGNGPDEDHPVDMFFNAPKFPNATVTINDYTDGVLTLTLEVVGKELTQKVPVTVSSEENSASIKGDFSMDFDSLDIPGLQPNPEDGSQINPVIDFKLNVSLKK